MRGDGGSAHLLGGDPWADATALHRRLAYVPGDVTLWPGLTGGEVIDLLGRLRGGVDRRRRDDLIDRFELDPRKKGRAYSKGNRQKVALVAAPSAEGGNTWKRPGGSAWKRTADGVATRAVATPQLMGWASLMRCAGWASRVHRWALR